LAVLWVALGALSAFALAPSAALAGDANEAFCPPETEASPGFRAFMPDCRADELVTPPYKDGNIVFELGAISDDGNRFLGNSYGGFAGTGNNEQGSLLIGAAIYEFERSSDGWNTEALNPSAQSTPFSGYVSSSTDLSSTLWELDENPGDTEILYTIPRLTLELRVHQPGSSPRFIPIGPEDSPTQTRSFLNFEPAGTSSDLSHVVFSIEPREGSLWPGDTTTEEPSLYEYVGTGNSEPTLVGVKNDGPLHGSPHINEGAELISRCGIEFGDETDTYNAVSASGETVFFSARECSDVPGEPEVKELYARSGGERTIAISEPSLPAGEAHCTSGHACFTATRSAASFQGASEDGSRVFFTTNQPLVNGDEDTTSDLYMAEIQGQGAAAHLANLVQVSHNSHSAEAAEVQGVERVSEDGSRVYFVAKGALTGANAEAKSPTVGADNLYVYDTETGHLAFVATLSEEDGEEWSSRDERRVQATPSGGFAVFPSLEHLTGAEDTSTVPQLFEYDAETEHLARVSIGQKGSYLCPQTEAVQSGFNCNGNTTIPANEPGLTRLPYAGNFSPTTATSALVVSNDGRVFFSSLDALTPLAREGSANVYEYSGGNVYLIAPGEDLALEQASFGVGAAVSSGRLIGTDRAGTDLFFGAVGPQVPQDTDNQADIYDARVAGGFPAPPAPKGCQEETCQGAGSVVPSLAAPVTATLSGAGNLAPEPVVTVAKPKPSTRVKPATRAQRLAKALKACRRVKPAKKRLSCEKQARKLYGAKAARAGKPGQRPTGGN
jgi:hypothetical protein